jgi:hypothetical protein
LKHAGGFKGKLKVKDIRKDEYKKRDVPGKLRRGKAEVRPQTGLILIIALAAVIMVSVIVTFVVVQGMNFGLCSKGHKGKIPSAFAGALSPA